MDQQARAASVAPTNAVTGAAPEARAASSQPDAPAYDQEQAAIDSRRAHFFAAADQAAPLWGLGLSGGGIRSATFCLGVLQALARADFGQSGAAPARSNTPLLARFDFLSTVSGGGYVGGFLSALFRPRPPTGQSAPSADEAAQAAFDALQQEPPGRLGAPNSAGAPDTPLRWLRENGRYLTPTGPGDLVYDVSIAVRNLFAVHVVVGMALLSAFLGTFFFRTLSLIWPGGKTWLIEVIMQPGNPAEHGAIWWSPWWLLAGLWVFLAILPVAIAYWYKVDQPKKWLLAPWRVVALLLLLCVLAGLGAAGVFGDGFVFNARAAGFLAAAALLGLSLVVYATEAWTTQGKDTRVFRANLTRDLSIALQGLAVLVAFSLIETCGQTLYLWLATKPGSTPTVASVLAALTALVAALRQFAPALAQPEKGGLLSRLPVDAILGVLGVLLAGTLLVLWYTLSAFLFLGPLDLPQSNELPLVALAYVGGQGKLLAASLPWGLLGLCLLTAAACGYFLGFVNLSSLQTMYSARLARAYLGASNRQRFAQPNGVLAPVTEPDNGDDFSLADFYARPHYGPAHIINTTINATTGSGDQLTQRDRHGLPLAVTPQGVMVEGRVWWNRVPAAGNTEPVIDALNISQWIGISGAAFSTGIGRGTTLGKAMLLSIVNVRLGWWWNSGNRDQFAPLPFWRNQTYLLREFRASFMGRDGAHWYLSDGGHFENLAVFELLRRHVPVIVCCDCGADPDYQLGDLANMMRLARVDFGAEFQLIDPQSAPELFGARAGELGGYFAADESQLDLASAGTNNKCALLYRVSYAGSAAQSLFLLLKPRLILDAPQDIHEYRAVNPSFPQQSTTDQFFDDAQWESYRKLGLTIGERLFPPRPGL